MANPLPSVAMVCGLVGLASVANPQEEVNGILIHRMNSPAQARETTVKVLLPDSAPRDGPYRVLYVLPVEPQEGRRWGRGLERIQARGLHNEYDLICVEPGFSDFPWYADHPGNRELRQESYFLKDVVPLVDDAYPTLEGREGRLLVGFSKSGWGAWSLLLRHPEMFERAAAWDAPLNKDLPNQFGMERIFGTAENFEGYRINTLLERQAAELRRSNRLVLTGYGSFREHHQAIHEQLLRLEIPHDYRDGPHREHHWETGWLPEAIRLLAAKDRQVR